MRLWVFLQKEFLLLSRDLHALLLLFLMPTIFILIMSLAMQNTFSSHSTVKIDYLLLNEDEGDVGTQLSDSLAQNPYYNRIDLTGSFAQLVDATRSDEAQFLLHIPAGFSKMLAASMASLAGSSRVAEPGSLQVYIAPATQAPTAALFESTLTQLVGQRLLQSRRAASVRDEDAGESVTVADNALAGLINVQPASENSSVIPTSVQQNVPAWLVFSMFFIAIPVSTTLLSERAHGTLHRLVTSGVSSALFLCSKLFTYMLINLLQVVLMFAVGIWLVPKLGGDALTLGNAPFALFLIALATSFAAVSFALLIANIAQTTEQATIFAGVSNIVLAALGGVMVPRFVMPPTMQSVSLYSPHSWGLEGFLDVILRGGGVAEVLPEVARLCVFASVVLLFALFLFSRR